MYEENTFTHDFFKFTRNCAVYTVPSLIVLDVVSNFFAAMMKYAYFNQEAYPLYDKMCGSHQVVCGKCLDMCEKWQDDSQPAN